MACRKRWPGRDEKETTRFWVTAPWGLAIPSGNTPTQRLQHSIDNGLHHAPEELSSLESANGSQFDKSNTDSLIQRIRWVLFLNKRIGKPRR